MFWFSRSQKGVAISTTEADYTSIAETEGKVLVLQQTQCRMLPGVGAPCAPPVFEGNPDVVLLAQNLAANSILFSHVHERHHFLGKLVAKGVNLHYARTVGMEACRFYTKSLSAEAFQFRCSPVIAMGWFRFFRFGWFGGVGLRLIEMGEHR